MATGKPVQTKHERGRNAVRAFNKRLLNPVMLRLAGRRHWYAAALRHTGRNSGKSYTTPVVAERIGHGFVIPLPYGTKVDWLRNTLAAGHAVIEAKGATYEVEHPTVIDAGTAFSQISRTRGRAWRLFGIRQYLRVDDRAEEA